MHHRVAIVALLLLGGCPKKPPSSTDQPVIVDGGFVDLGDDDEDLDDLVGSELMMATARCGDLMQLEPAAMMGKLKDGEIRCLDSSLRDAERQTVKDKISRVLMADAWAKGDRHRWEGIVRRHLTDIDQSDPDLCYKFAKYLSGMGAEYADETMHWADVALENKAIWSGDTHVKRVFNLYKIKAYAAQARWDWYERKYLEAPNEEMLRTKGEARNQAKNLAREWLEYARQAGKDPTIAEQLCVSAAGTSGYCDVD